ncbi:hypothetical protein PMPD1_3721 [Paramixta manurensis]|uniref:Uncharacterized protein n=1 Tax=Paramixta manurensis TaxID=2740817 RepID=A0A6M8UDH7_9GAMM|nr:hypothetical protein PMPD1_3721 [Erwiniaceae bacterium PD-1]
MTVLFAPRPLLAATQATLFIDSAEPQQAALAAEINQALFYSPTLRAALTVTVFDINPNAHPFNGEVIYHIDSDGKAVAQYRPGRLPYLFCQADGKTRTHFTVSNKDQLCLCINLG